MEDTRLASLMARQNGWSQAEATILWLLRAMARSWSVANFGRGGTTVSQSLSCNRTAGSYAKASLYEEAVRWKAHIYVVMLGVGPHRPSRTPVHVPAS